MAQLIVRNIDDDIVQELKERAARNGRSAEAEHREILKAVLRPPPDRENFRDFLLRIPVGSHQEDDFVRNPDLGRDLDW